MGAVRRLEDQLPTYEQRSRITELSEVRYGDGDAWLAEFEAPATRGEASQIIKTLLERPEYYVKSDKSTRTLSPEAHAWAAQHKASKDPVSEANKAKVEASVQSRRQTPEPPSPPPASPQMEIRTPARWRYFDALMDLVEDEAGQYNLSQGHLNTLLDRIERLVAVIDRQPT